MAMHESKETLLLKHDDSRENSYTWEQDQRRSFWTYRNNIVASIVIIGLGLSNAVLYFRYQGLKDNQFNTRSKFCKVYSFLSTYHVLTTISRTFEP